MRFTKRQAFEKKIRYYGNPFLYKRELQHVFGIYRLVKISGHLHGDLMSERVRRVPLSTTFVRVLLTFFYHCTLSGLLENDFFIFLMAFHQNGNFLNVPVL